MNDLPDYIQPDLQQHADALEPSCLLIRSNLERIAKPIIIGIAGDSGSGKTTFSNGIRQLLGEKIVKTIEMDGYHTENRAKRAETGHLPLDPSINNLALLRQHLEQLHNWQAVDIPIYNHQTGDFDAPRHLDPAPVIVIEGLHALYPEFLDLLDFKLYVDPNRDIKWQWKKKRDIVKRGHEAERLTDEMLKREAAYKRWIDFQKTNATIVIKIFPSQLESLARYEFTGTTSENCLKMELIFEPSKKPLPSIILPFDLGMIMDNKTPPFMLASVQCKYWGRDMLDIHIDGELENRTVSALSRHIEMCTGINVGNAFSSSESFNNGNLTSVSTTHFTQLMVTWRFLELANEKILEQQGTISV